MGLFTVELRAYAEVHTKVTVAINSDDPEEAKRQALAEAEKGDVIWHYRELTDEPHIQVTEVSDG